MSAISSRQVSNFVFTRSPCTPGRPRQPKPYSSPARGKRAERDAFLQHHGRPPEGIRVVLVMAGRVDLVPGGQADEDGVVVDGEVVQQLGLAFQEPPVVDVICGRHRSGRPRGGLVRRRSAVLGAERGGRLRIACDLAEHLRAFGQRTLAPLLLGHLREVASSGSPAASARACSASAVASSISMPAMHRVCRRGPYQGHPPRYIALTCAFMLRRVRFCPRIRPRAERRPADRPCWCRWCRRAGCRPRRPEWSRRSGRRPRCGRRAAPGPRPCPCSCPSRRLCGVTLRTLMMATPAAAACALAISLPARPLMRPRTVALNPRTLLRDVAH